MEKSVIASVDVSLWMGAALNHKESLDEQFMESRISVLAVAKYVRTFFLLLINDNIKPVLVVDGPKSTIETGYQRETATTDAADDDDDDANDADIMESETAPATTDNDDE